MPENTPVERIFSKDASFWSDDPAVQDKVANRMGWLDVDNPLPEQLTAIRSLVEDARQMGIKDILLLGMGGSSLAPDVFSQVAGSAPGRPTLNMLDSTNPGRVLAVRAGMDPASTYVIVSSKSGSTIETLSLYRYFREQYQAAGVRNWSDHFISITDPGSPLQLEAEQEGFRACFLNAPDIGGRYSALSLFGLVPAALIGVDINAVLDTAADARSECKDGIAGAQLGEWLAGCYTQGRDKLALVLPAGCSSIAAWVEQLVAESLGKQGKGVLPYSCNSLEAGLRADGVCIEWLPGAGQSHLSSPWVWKEYVGDARDLGRLYYNWEFAIALAAGLIGVNPFDEPDVAAAKANTARLLAGDGIDSKSMAVATLGGVLDFLADVGAGDYITLLAYLPVEGGERSLELQQLRQKLESRVGVPVTLNEGPRYLHSTGQYHKGGPKTGHHIVIVPDAMPEVGIPGEDHDFASVLRAQARGDYEALRARDRPAVQVSDVLVPELLSVF